jgi:hypothetical protein
VHTIKVLLGILNPRVNILLVTVGWRAGRRISQLPKAVNEFIPILICRQIEENIPLLVGNDVIDLIRNPCAIARREVLDRGLGQQGRKTKD